MPDKIFRSIHSGDDKLDHAIHEAMNTQRAAAFIELLDIVNDMNADGLDLLRKFGEKGADGKPNAITRFLKNADDKTLEFFAGLREDEVADVKDGLEFYRAFKTAGTLIKWSIISLGGMAAAIVAIKSLWYGKP